MRFPDFIAAKRAQAPDYARAEYIDILGDNAKYEKERDQYEQRVNMPFAAYKGYTELTDTNPIADAVRGFGGGGSAGGTMTPNAPVGPEPGGAGQNMGAPIGMETSSRAAALGMNPANMMNAGSNAGIKTLDGLSAAQAGQQMSTMLPQVTEVAGGEVAGKMGSAALGAAGGAATGGILSGAMEAQNPYTNDQRIGVKAAGGASTGALMASAAPLAAAGPAGWAAIAGMAAMSLYGMLV